ncbi:MAG: hypothetical protein NC416_08855 [Eubacterium sp.]|nr:hypothetical protein [Eubacterium sp.]
MKRQEGSLTVEATISLTIYLFAMMFLVNVGQVYRAQNYMVHGLMQTGQMLSFASYEYGEDTTLSKLGDTFMSLFRLVGGMSDKSEMKDAWKYGHYPQAAKLAFGYCAGENAGATNQYLRKYGISGGIDSIDFTKTCRQEDDLCLWVQYRVDLPFAFFNIDHIDMHQQIVCGLWEK